MELEVERTGDVNVVVPQAEFLNANTSRESKDELPTVLSYAGEVLLDLGDVQFMDGGGCGAVLAALKKLRMSGGDLKICCITNPVRALFDLVRMQRIVGVFKTREEAVAAFAQSVRDI